MLFAVAQSRGYQALPLCQMPVVAAGLECAAVITRGRLLVIGRRAAFSWLAVQLAPFVLLVIDMYSLAVVPFYLDRLVLVGCIKPNRAIAPRCAMAPMAMTRRVGRGWLSSSFQIANRALLVGLALTSLVDRAWLRQTLSYMLKSGPKNRRPIDSVLKIVYLVSPDDSMT